MTVNFHTLKGGFVDYGGPGSGNFGHAGRSGKLGGSAPKSGVGGAMSIVGGRTASARQAHAAGKEGAMGPGKELMTPETKQKYDFDASGDLQSVKTQLKSFGIGAMATKDPKLALTKGRIIGEELAGMVARRPGLGKFLENDSMLLYLSVEKGKTIKNSQGKAVNGTFDHRGGGSIRIASGLQGHDGLTMGSGSFLVSGGFKGALRHEYGHAVLTHSSSRVKSDWASVWNKEGGSFAKKVSKYSSTNSREAFAESFSAWTSSRYGAVSNRALPKEVHAFFEENF